MSLEDNMGDAISVIGSGELPQQESLVLLRHAFSMALHGADPDKETGMFFLSRRSNDGTDVEVQAVINPSPSTATHSREGNFYRYAEITVDDGTDNPNRYSLWYRGDPNLPRGVLYELRPVGDRSPWSEGAVQRMLGIVSVHTKES